MIGKTISYLIGLIFWVLIAIFVNQPIASVVALIAILVLSVVFIKSAVVYSRTGGR